MKENLKVYGKMYVMPKQVLKKNGEPMNKYEFIIVANENSDYPDYIPFTMLGKSYESFPAVKVGDDVEVEFKLGGRMWNDRCFGENLAWAVRPANNMNADIAKTLSNEEPEDEDLPF